MRVAAQVEVAVAQTGRLVDRVLVELERERLRACHDLERLDLDLDLSGREIRVDRVGRPADDLALRPKHELAANLVRDVRRVGGPLGVDHELADPGVVTEIDEDEAAVVAAPRRPAGERQLSADVRGGHFAAVLVAPLVHPSTVAATVSRVTSCSMSPNLIVAPSARTCTKPRAPERASCVRWPFIERPA